MLFLDKKEEDVSMHSIPGRSFNTFYFIFTFFVVVLTLSEIIAKLSNQVFFGFIGSNGAIERLSAFMSLTVGYFFIIARIIYRKFIKILTEGKIIGINEAIKKIKEIAADNPAMSLDQIIDAYMEEIKK